MTDEDIDTSEILPVPLEMFAKGIVRRGLKPVVTQKQVTIRVDSDVLEWFKDQGHGYQTQINALPRAYYGSSSSRSANILLHLFLVILA